MALLPARQSNEKFTKYCSFTTWIGIDEWIIEAISTFIGVLHLYYG